MKRKTWMMIVGLISLAGMMLFSACAPKAARPTKEVEHQNSQVLVEKQVTRAREVQREATKAVEKEVERQVRMTATPPPAPEPAPAN